MGTRKLNQIGVRPLKAAAVGGFLVLVSTAIGGCLTLNESSSEGNGNGRLEFTPGRECFKSLGNATPPDSEGALWIQEKYGLHQIHDRPQVAYSLNIDGGLITWLVGSPFWLSGPSINCVIGYDISAQNLIEISDNYNLTYKLPVQSDGHVVFSGDIIVGVTPPEQTWSGIEQWDYTSRNSTRVELNIDGALLPKGFEYPWLLMEAGSGDTHGAWVLNVETMDYFRISEPDLEGVGPAPQGLAISGGFAYVIYSYKNEDGHNRFFLKEVNVVSQEERILCDCGGTALTADYPFIAWTENNIQTALMDVSTGAVSYPFQSNSRGGTYFPTLGGNWLITSERGHRETNTLAYHIPTDSIHRVIQDDRVFTPGDQKATDGVRLVIQMWKRDESDHLVDGLYWMDLPEVG